MFGKILLKQYNVELHVGKHCRIDNSINYDN